MNIDELEAAALDLPASDRARLADRLFASLEPDEGFDHAWTLEIRERLRRYSAGASEALDADEVFKRAYRGK
jgi:putative addiction module component (TIGR02574 family)